jgi:hypothetical protein
MDGLASLQTEIIKYFQNQPITLEDLVHKILSTSLVREMNFDLLFDLIFCFRHDRVNIEKYEILIYRLNERLPSENSLLFKQLLHQYLKNSIDGIFPFLYQYLLSKLLADGFFTETDVDFDQIGKTNLPIFLPYFIRKKMPSKVSECFQEMHDFYDLEMLWRCVSVDSANFYSILGHNFGPEYFQLTPKSELIHILKADDIEAYRMLVAHPGRRKCEHGESDISIAAAYGALKIFKFLMLTDGFGDFRGECAISGGNAEIIRLCQHNEVDVTSEECLQFSVDYHQIDLFDWILKMNPRLEKNKIIWNAIRWNNAHVLWKLSEEEDRPIEWGKASRLFLFYVDEVLKKTKSQQKYVSQILKDPKNL